MVSGNRVSSWCRRLATAAVLLGLVACARGPFSPEAREQSASLDRYMKELQAAIVIDDTFTWNTLSSALIVKALPYTPAVAQAAGARYASDPVYAQETAQWRTPLRNRRPPLVILMGIFAPDLKEKDITQLGRFRPGLMTPDGRILAPLEIKRYGRDSVFMRDHFPIFNPWEEVYLVKFPAYGGDWGYERLDFRLEWPGGVQTLPLGGRAD